MFDPLQSCLCGFVFCRVSHSLLKLLVLVTGQITPALICSGSSKVSILSFTKKSRVSGELCQFVPSEDLVPKEPVNAKTWLSFCLSTHLLLKSQSMHQSCNQTVKIGISKQRKC